MATDEANLSNALEQNHLKPPPLGSPFRSPCPSSSSGFDSPSSSDDFSVDPVLLSIDPALFDTPQPTTMDHATSNSKTDNDLFADYTSSAAISCPPLPVPDIQSEPSSPFAHAFDQFPNFPTTPINMPRAQSQPPRTDAPAVIFHRGGTPVGVSHPFPAALKRERSGRNRTRGGRYHPYKREDTNTVAPGKPKRTMQLDTVAVIPQRTDGDLPDIFSRDGQLNESRASIDHQQEAMHRTLIRIEQLTVEIWREYRSLWGMVNSSVGDDLRH
ncbi:hypothetical protein NA57DRAFT_71617 [Rhizodiscina lignyota]|uniref:Uncharacterized protein n=1 Tax=Rhizodiscina lignyota TaxID=1504668 RepID=A0A9P4INT0_9PEZI|nr:hypothetical protein NA57DRAFT_71617 [Rhizodiscina lignyota]